MKYERNRKKQTGNLTAGGPITEPPANMAEDAVKLWQAVVAALPVEVLQTLDTFALQGMCEWWAQWRTIQAAMRKLSPIDAEYYKCNQMAAIAWKHFSTTAAKFGLSPSDRAKLGIEAPAKAEENPFNAIRRSLGMEEIPD